MDSSIFLGGSVVAAFAAGVIALMAPCCISVMLPAYFASSFQNRRVLVAMTFVFAAGIATVILPLALGASALRNLINAQHSTVYVTGGILMLGLGLYSLAGGQLKLPMPGRSAHRRGGVLGVYSLGLFSGIASSCCAPVLAGVLALSGVAASFLWALGLGTAYVFGMVAPLFVISLLWDRYDWRSSGVFRPRSFTFRLGSHTRTVSGTGIASGTLLTVMGAAAIWIGVSTESMPGGSGWQARVAVELQSWGRRFTDALAWLPSWAAVVILTALVLVLAAFAVRQVGRGRPQPSKGRTIKTTETKRRRTMTRTGSPKPRSGKPTTKGGGALWPVLAVAGIVVGLLFVVFLLGGGSESSAGGPPYAVGNPGPGEQAPPLRLPSANGGTFDLAEMEGQRVLLYFQEGIMCQPCWDQLSDIEARWDEFDARGIDAIASITSDDLGPLQAKVELEGLSTPVLSDPGVEVSETWEANLYGMMGTSMNGHSFVLVGPDGEIEWRADYGGAPDYTMYVPVDQLLAHLDAGTSGGAGQR